MMTVQFGILEIIRQGDGETIRLNGKDIYIVGDTGFGVPKSTIITQKGPLQDGATVIDSYLDSKGFSIVIMFHSKDIEEYYTTRHRIYDVLKPGTLLNIKVTNRSGVRMIDAYYVGGLELNSTERGMGGEGNKDIWTKAAISFVAHDPLWYAETEDTIVFTIFDLQYLSFPFSFPDLFRFDSDRVYSVDPHQYLGEWKTFPIITLTGPLTGLRIENTTMDAKLWFNYVIVLGETVVINCLYGQKTVISSINGNIIGALSLDSDLSTFHIAPAPEAPDGINDILISATTLVPGTSEINIDYHAKYLGV